MREWIKLFENATWWNKTEEELRAFAEQYVGFATNEMGDPEELSWTFEEQYPLYDLKNLQDWDEYFLDDVRGNPRYNKSFEAADFHTPIVVSYEEGELIIWDGYHRIATAIYRGDETIMAVVGRDEASKRV